MSLFKRAAANLALVIAAIVVALLFGELVLRVTPLGKTAFYTYDSYLGWMMKPGARGWQQSEGKAFVRVNRWGYRGPEWTPKKPPGTFRIAVLGDSFTEAQQVAENDTFCAVMQRVLKLCPALKARGYRRVEVMDFGCDSYGTAQELITLKRHVWQFAPDMVVLAVYLGNDIRNNSVVLEGDKCRPFYVYRGGKLVLGGPFEDSWRFRTGCMMRFESRHSQVLNLLGSARSAVRAWWRRRKAREAAGRNRGKPARVPKPGVADLVYRPPGNQVWRAAWRVTEGEIEMIRQSVAENGARLLVVTLSTPVQVSPDSAARAAFAKWLGVPNLFYPDCRIRQFGARGEYPVLTLAPLMQQYAGAHHVYLHGFFNTRPGIGHWNVVGHRVAGTLIAGRICAMLAPDAPRAAALSPNTLASDPCADFTAHRSRATAARTAAVSRGH